MLESPTTFNEEYFVNYVREWFAMIATNQRAEAFARLDLPPQFGDPITAESFLADIDTDHYAEGTVYRKQNPGPIEFTAPDEIGPSEYTDVYVEDDTGIVEVQHPIPLRGEWTDLMATFHFVPINGQYAVRFDSFYVH
jgi:hypothetical protein